MSEGWCYLVVSIDEAGCPWSEMVYLDGDKTGSQFTQAAQLFAKDHPQSPIISVEEFGGVS